MFFHEGTCSPGVGCVYNSTMSVNHPILHSNVLNKLFHVDVSDPKLYMCLDHGRVHVCTMTRENCHLKQSQNHRDHFKCSFTGQMCTGDNPETAALIRQRRQHEKVSAVREVDWLQHMTTVDNGNACSVTNSITKVVLLGNSSAAEDVAGCASASSCLDDDRPARSSFSKHSSDRSTLRDTASMSGLHDKRASKLQEEIRNKARAKTIIVQMGHESSWLSSTLDQMRQLASETNNHVAADDTAADELDSSSSYYKEFMDPTSNLYKYVYTTAANTLTVFRYMIKQLITKPNVTSTDSLRMANTFGKIAVDHTFYHLTSLVVEKEKVEFQIRSSKWKAAKLKRRTKRLQTNHDILLRKAKQIVDRHKKKKRAEHPSDFSTAHLNRIDYFTTSISKICAAYYRTYLEKIKSSSTTQNDV